MSYLQKLKEYLGAPYTIKEIDGTDTIYRKIGDNYELEVFKPGTLTVYVHSVNPRSIVGIYTGIKDQEDLKDFLGYLVTKYQNLLEKVQVEREE